jgi:hypothetical protein
MKALRWTLALLLSLLVMTVAGCATKPVTQTVLVPCGQKVGPAPAYPFAAVSPTATVHTKVKVLLAERKLRQARELELTAALTACR